MPTVSLDLQRTVSRFRDQRWMLDAVIKIIGPQFDQARLVYLGGPCHPDHRMPILGLASTMKKWDDIAPEFTKAARRYELQGKESVQQGHTVSASDAYFTASILYGGAQWPIFDNTPFNLALEQKKTECYLEYIKGADHRIELVEVPYQGRTLPGYFHLPPGYQGGKLPCMVMVSGMDAFKEMVLSFSGDNFLRRGFACLCLDGPGQGACLTHEIWYDPDCYGEVGVAAYEAMAARPEVDSGKIMTWGLSFGSFWATQMAAAEPRYAACAVMFACFQPGNWPLYEMAAPSFKQRFMYMAGIRDEAAFEAYSQKIDVRPLSAKLRMPYLVLGGEDDELSDIACTIEHLNNVTSPKTFVMYAGEIHGMGAARSAQLGPPCAIYVADWLVNRAAGKPLDSTYNVVDSTGQVHTQAWGERQTFEYGAPMDFQQLFGDGPQTGTA